MKLCFYSPYIPKHFGGGEKHLFDVACVAAEQHQVTIVVSEDKVTAENSLTKIKKSYETFLDKNLGTIAFETTPLGTTQSAVSKLLWTQQYDGIYYLTDGSLFFSLARKNYLHIQTPFTFQKNSILERFKLANWQHKNSNSEFTKLVIEEAWQTKIDTVLHPMVDTHKFMPTSKKSKIILSVGRFFRQLHSKRQDVLVEIFIDLLRKYPTVMNGWKLQLVGSIEDKEYFDAVVTAAKSYPIEVLSNVSGQRLLELYNSAMIYWHAAGFGVDEIINPEKVEHFGISTVEAMAAGAVPIVQYKGGQKEILGPELAFCGWVTEQNCIDVTLSVIKDKVTLTQLQKLAVARAENFNKTLFEKKVRKMFEYEK